MGASFQQVAAGERCCQQPRRGHQDRRIADVSIEAVQQRNGGNDQVQSIGLDGCLHGSGPKALEATPVF